MNVEAEIALTLDIGFDVRHLEMVVDPVDHEVREPWVFSTDLEQLVEKLQAFLSEVVAEDLEAHQRLVLTQCLGEEGEPHIVDLIIGHVQMNQTAIDSYSLGDGLRTVVTAFVVSDVQCLQGAVVRFEVLCEGLTSSEGQFVGIEVENLERIVFKKVLHDDVEAIVSQLVLSHRNFLQTNIILEHLTKVNRN